MTNYTHLRYIFVIMNNIYDIYFIDCFSFTLLKINIYYIDLRIMIIRVGSYDKPQRMANNKYKM
jgi:hypothetical protein